MVFPSYAMQVTIALHAIVVSKRYHKRALFVRLFRVSERYPDFSPVIRGSTSEDAPNTRCHHFQQMAVGVAEVKRLTSIFPGLP